MLRKTGVSKTPILQEIIGIGPLGANNLPLITTIANQYGGSCILSFVMLEGTGMGPLGAKIIRSMTTIVYQKGIPGLQLSQLLEIILGWKGEMTLFLMSSPLELSDSVGWK